jgi:hypothetical protein
VDGGVVHLLDQLPITQNGKPPEIRETTIFQFQPQPAKIWVPSNEPAPVIGDLLTGFRVSLRGGLLWNPGTYVDNPQNSTLATWKLGADGKFARLDEVELGHESTFHLVGSIGVVYERANQPHLLDLSTPSAIRNLGFHSFEGAPSLNYQFADGAAERGLWIPADQYGLEAFVFAP